MNAISITPDEDELQRRAIQIRALPSYEDLQAQNAQKANAIPTQADQTSAISTKPGGPAISVDQANPTGAHRSALASLWTKADNIHNPFLRVLGKVGAGLVKGIDVASSMAAPRIAEEIPGTTAHEELKAAQGRAEENRRAKVGLETAEAEEATARAKAAGNPGQEKEGQTVTTDEGVFQWDPATKRYDTRVGGVPEKTKNPIIHESDQGIFMIDPVTRQATPLTYNGQTLMPKKTGQGTTTGEDLKNRIAQAFEKGDIATVKKLQDELKAIDPEGAQRIAIQLQNQGERGNRQDMATREKVLTYWQPTLDSAERFNVMAKNYRDGLKGDQQAMLSLLANHLGMTMGLQKGVRLNQAIIAEAMKSRPWLQGLAAKFDKDGYLTGVTLTPEQMKQMLSLGAERYAEDVKKSRAAAAFIGITEEPTRKLSKEGAHFYLEAAGNDATKARAMAQEAGWEF